VKKLTCPGILLERILPGLGKGTVVAEMAVQGVDVADVSKNHRVLQTRMNIGGVVFYERIDPAVSAQICS
jgi:hypothetical protein